MRRRTRFNESSAKLVAYLEKKYSLTHAKIAAILNMDPAFVGRVAKAEREFSPRQTQLIADHLGVGKGAMFIDASPMIVKLSPEYQRIVELCERLMLLADAGYTPDRVALERKPA